MIRHQISAALLALMTQSVFAHDHAKMLEMQKEMEAEREKEPITLSSESLYHVQAALVDQQGKHFKLADEHGPATLITMFYGDCQIACPIALENVKRTLNALPAAQRPQFRALLISLNPGIDTPAKLSKLARLHALPASNFRFAVSEKDSQTHDSNTRELAAALGIKYRRTGNGEVNHSTRFVVIDQRGEIRGSSDKLAIEPDAQVLHAIQKQLAN